jgi:hypothetical protein
VPVLWAPSLPIGCATMAPEPPFPPPLLTHISRRPLWHAAALTVMNLSARVEIMGSQKCRIVGKSQPVHIMMINPIIFTRTRISVRGGAESASPVVAWWAVRSDSSSAAFVLGVGCRKLPASAA